MKTILCIALIHLFFQGSSSQDSLLSVQSTGTNENEFYTSDKINTSILSEFETKVKYCTVILNQNISNNKIEKVSLSYGQSIWFDSSDQMTDAGEKIQKYFSITDALNFMGSGGWKVISHNITIESSAKIHNFLMYKEDKS